MSTTSIIYSVRYSNPKLTGSTSLIATGLTSIRKAKQTASYYSVSAPPVHTHVCEGGTGRIVAVYFNGQLRRESAQNVTTRLACDQCSAASINGVFCHETGCPNSRKTWDPERGQWIRYVECRECGCDVEQGEVCDCQNTEAAQ
ncbi:MAG TPA: hypothetical protein VGQ49_00625 [Bryobacteraceae bacterium]|jgi:hypothetical protein|nr:hypothetical protein [Bryobacteraceae bacterium]